MLWQGETSTQLMHRKTFHEEWGVNWGRLKHKPYQSESTILRSGGDFDTALRFDYTAVLNLKLSGPGDSCPCLLWGIVFIKYLINSRKREFSRNNLHMWHHFSRPHSCAINYISMTLSTVLARTRHKNHLIGQSWQSNKEDKQTSCVQTAGRL